MRRKAFGRSTQQPDLFSGLEPGKQNRYCFAALDTKRGSSNSSAYCRSASEKKFGSVTSLRFTHCPKWAIESAKAIQPPSSVSSDILCMLVVDSLIGKDAG